MFEAKAKTQKASNEQHKSNRRANRQLHKINKCLCLDEEEMHQEDHEEDDHLLALSLLIRGAQAPSGKRSG